MATKIKSIMMEGLVVMKIAKFCDEDSGGPDMVAGLLLGMVDGERLEVTNCFAFPRATDNSDFDDAQYQMYIQKAHRNVNIDHLQVGWFQPSIHGNFINKIFLETQFSYQSSIAESVAIMYDPLKTSKGCLSMKAYRLTSKTMELYSKNNSPLSVEVLKKAGLTFDNMFDEVPIEIKVSPLANILLHKLKREYPVPAKVEFLNLSHGSSLEHQLRLMLASIDEMSQENGKFLQYQRMMTKYNQTKNLHIQRRAAENAARANRGESPLPEEDINKVLRPVMQPQRIDALLASQQITQYCDQINQFSTKGLGRIFMAEAMEYKE